MKKLLLVSAASLIFIAIVNAQSKSSEASTNSEQLLEKKETKKQKLNEIITQARNKFNKEFGLMPNVKWKKTATFYRASFRKEGQHFKVFYDEQVKQIGTISHKSFADLPVNAQQYINSNYKNYHKKDIMFFDDNEQNETDMILFAKHFEDRDSYFVELKKWPKKIVLKISLTGEVSFFKQLK